MKLFSAGIIAAASAQMGDMDMGGMMAQFMPMVEAKYNSLDHEQMHRDFMEDNTGLFERYFEFCDIGGDGVLTPEDDLACREKAINLIQSRIPFPLDDIGAMGLPIDQASAVTEMIFEKFIDLNHDGSTTLEELQMGAYCLLRTAAQLGLQFMGDQNAELPRSMFPDFDEMSEQALEAINSEEAQVYFRGHQGLYQKLQRTLSTRKIRKVFKSADIDGNNAYNDRELVKLLFLVGEKAVELVEMYLGN
ncbi:Oidioi.mRNA.OKI2018_I69.PAR.g11837.t1.cds [Oikopleura dioica]|uniref:Oidioi.mRNA.OKI2018_I69.PAR.g11837.t1.cds n=1 Tax=Oikopleura dioica TaxID=34765 RepID=A0ABN7S3V5_OIKDI|nr:Oidioi.mRNA.OKI2018_I69.PAR.g11837.t1.cds [Oikopleura dioica]